MHAVRPNDNFDSAEAHNTLLMFGGIALMLLGAGLVLSSPVVRRYLSGLNLAALLQTAAPELERFMKLKPM